MMRAMEPDVVVSMGGRLAIHISLLIEASRRLPNGSIAVLRDFLSYGVVSGHSRLPKQDGRYGLKILTSLLSIDITFTNKVASSHTVETNMQQLSAGYCSSKASSNNIH